MTKQISCIAIAFFCLISVSINAQSLWTKSSVSKFRDANEEDKMVLPEKYIAYSLSYEELKNELINTPNEESRKNGISGTIINLPMPNGSFEPFEVYDSPVFAPKLAAKYPSIKSYKGKSLKTPGMNVRFDTGPYGFHAAINSISNVFYIDPYAREHTTEYLTYDVKDHVNQLEIPVPLCGVLDEVKESKVEIQSKPRSNVPVNLHVYRLALACTGEWGAVRGTVEKALADMNTGVNRVNQIFENELAIRLVLIDDNDLLINLDSTTDPYLQTALGVDILFVNTNILNLRVGSDAYDIGHVYNRACQDVGGVALLGAMCNNSIKGAGVTCHFNSNLNYIAANTTSHEIAHQMTANHTFNNCAGNESPVDAFEPGSGSTIMSYAGGCGQQNVVQDGDIYYHVNSLIEIYNHTRGNGVAGVGCAEVLETSNLEPKVEIFHENGFIIPEQTHFYLEGIGTDENEDDQLTYTWEQMNRGPTSNLGMPIGDAPHFRSMPPGLSPLRFFPSSDNIMNGSFDRTEVAFEGDRTVNFMLTVRDNNAEAGTAVWEEIEFNVVDTPVKFEVTSQNSSESYKVGDEIDITWNVAGTNFFPVNAKRVDILLFTGNAATFSLTDPSTITVLAKDVFNSGSCKVILPNLTTNKARIIVKASESIFFSINKTNVNIEELQEPKLFINSEPLAQLGCLPTSDSYKISSEEFGSIEGDITYTVLDGLPDGASISFDPEVSQAGASSILTINPPNNFLGGDYQIRVAAITENMDTFTRLLYYNLRSLDHRQITAINPPFNAVGISVTPPVFNWEHSPNADFYTFELSKSPEFGSTNIEKVIRYTDNLYQPDFLLEINTVYYWRITAENDCGVGPEPKIFSFSTESLFCTEVEPKEGDLPINISGSGTPTIQALLEVPLNGNVADINIKQFTGEHENNKDLVVKLISPEGKEVTLVANKCEQSNFNCQFDDESDVDVKCPLNNGKVYKPVGSLASFNGDELEGTWIFQVEDTKGGNGGKLQNVKVEFCSSQVLDNPYIVNNKKILLPWNGTRTISKNLLAVDDDNNSKEELIYTIVELPKKGQLNFDNNSVSIGDQFSQKDIDDDMLVYNAVGEDYDTYFSFTIIDGEGGFIGITNFEINVDELVSIDEKQLEGEISIYPIPTRNMITIDFTRSSQEYLSYEILNLQGQSVLNNKLTNKDKIDVNVSQLTPGFYIVNLRSGNNIVSKKIIVN